MAAGCLVAAVGCGGSDDDSSSDDGTGPPPYAASSPADDASQAVPQLPGDRPGDLPRGDLSRGDDFAGQSQALMPSQGGNPEEVATPDPTAGIGQQIDDAAVESKLQLRADLSPEKLTEFLAAVDGEIKRIWTGGGGADQQKVRDELLRIVKLKLQASRRLVVHADAGPAQRSEGARGELQALSHLAVMGDLQSADDLEQLAQDNLMSDDESLAIDCRLVLIGFAVESLQNGAEGASEKIVKLVQGYPDAGGSSDVPALMAMGQALQMLLQYDHLDEARMVRDTIIDRFADSSDAAVANLTAQIAGNVQFDEIDQLLISVTEGGAVSEQQWQQAVDTLIEESADLQTVEYLAGAAVEFESLSRDDLAKATYRSLAKNFDDPAAATGREVELALGAREARTSVIGRVFDPDLPGVGSQPPDLKTLRGKVVLMPFWATGFPDSLQTLPLLKSIREANPGSVEIVGVNLDPADSPLEEFLNSSELGFDSFHAVSDPTAKVINPVAIQFGMVTMPFMVILDQDAKVAAIKFGDRGVEDAVKSLLED